MNEDMLKIIGILVIVIFLIYLATKSIKLHLNVMEGLTMPSLSSTPDSNSDIAKFAESYKVATIKMHDTLLLSKYKTDYENLILNMDDFVKLQIVTLVSTGKFDEATKFFSYIPVLESAMKTIDNTK
jgi:hypothetical protein